MPKVLPWLNKPLQIYSFSAQGGEVDFITAFSSMTYPFLPKYLSTGL